MENSKDDNLPESSFDYKIFCESATFRQEADDREGNFQAITISQEDAGAGIYWKIQTDNWSFDKKEDLQKLIDKVAGMNELPVKNEVTV